MSARIELAHHVVAGLPAVRARGLAVASRGRLLFVHGLFGGPSAGPAAAPQGLENDVSDVVRAAGELQGPVLIGHSLGGLLVLKAAERAAPPAVVAITPAPPRGVFAVRHAALLGLAVRHAPAMVLGRPMLPGRRLTERLALHRLDAAERERVWRCLVPESGRQVLEITLPGLRVTPSRLRCACLVIAAGGDRLTPPGMVRRVARRYGAELREYAWLGHMLPLEAQWPRLAGDIAAWLEGAPGADLHALLEAEGLADQQAVPDAALAHGQRPETAHGHQLSQHDRARHDDVGPRGPETRQPPALSQR
jgi:pimeloyl-ACP methyl ester carboxylesterase